MIRNALFVLIALNAVAAISFGQAPMQTKENGSVDASVRTGLADTIGRTNAVDTVFVPSFKVWANDGGAGQYLGNAVAIAGDTAVVGNRVPNGLGSVYVFVRNGTSWSQQAKLSADDEIVNDDFGYTVAISGDYIVVGAPAARPNNDPYRGAAYVFFRTGTTWAQQAKLVASDGAPNDGFGLSIAITRDAYIVVGSPNHAVGANAQQGEAYFYSRSGTSWFEQKVTRANGAAGDRFGWSVAMSGFDAVVSSPFRDVNSAADQGEAYVYEVSGVTWSPIAVVDAPDGVAGNMFAEAVSMSGLTLGTLTIAAASTNAGKVYMFQRSGNAFPIQATILGPAGVGISDVIAIYGNSLFIGLSTATHNDIQSGIVLEYDRTGTQWSRSPDLFPADGANYDHFGTAVAANGNFAIFTAPWAGIGAGLDQGAAYVYRPYKNSLFDYDGDGKSDVSVYRPNTGVWYLNRSTAGFYAVQFGAPGDFLVPADYTGDGKTDMAVFRPSNGYWFIFRSEDSTLQFGGGFGQNGDIPVPGDYDGDGKADISVFRPSTGYWYLNRTTAGFAAVQFGQSGDVPTLGDFDGDGKTDIAVYRPSEGNWYRFNSSNGSFFGVHFGVTGDMAIPADYTGDGKTDVAVFRPSTGTWYILRSEDNSFYGAAFGTTGDIPSPGDYDGDGKADLTVFRPSQGYWYLQQTTAGFAAVQFGANGDRPTENAYVY